MKQPVESRCYYLWNTHRMQCCYPHWKSKGYTNPVVMPTFVKYTVFVRWTWPLNMSLLISLFPIWCGLECGHPIYNYGRSCLFAAVCFCMLKNKFEFKVFSASAKLCNFNNCEICIWKSAQTAIGTVFQCHVVVVIMDDIFIFILKLCNALSFIFTCKFCSLLYIHDHWITTCML